MFTLRHTAYATATAALLGLSVVGATATATAAGQPSTISVDGSVVAGTFSTTCQRQVDGISLWMEDANNAAYGDVQAAAMLRPADTVVAVTVAGTHGSASDTIGLGYNQNLHNGSAAVTKVGDTYTLTGAADAPSSGTSFHRTKTFQITFACPR